jgi:hypothetical protein
MLESLRAYGRDRLVDANELDAAIDAHVRWCIDLAEQAELGVRGTDQLAWLDRLDTEHDNLRAALTASVGTNAEAALRLVGALIVPWWFRGRGAAARHWIEDCLAAADDSDPASLMKTLTWCALVADFGGEADRPGGFERELELADERQRRAVAIGLADGDELGTAYALTMHALTLTRRALAGIAIDPSEIATAIESAIATFEARGDEFGASMVRTVAAVGYLGTGDAARAGLAAERARVHAVRCGNRYVLGRTEWIAGLLAREAGDLDGAYQSIERGLRLLDELGMGREVTAQAGLLVDLAARRGEDQLAALWQTFVAGRSGGLARHDAHLVASARNRVGLDARARGALEEARVAHVEALAGYEDGGASSAIAFTESCLGFLSAEMGDVETATAHHAAALDAAAATGEPAALALALEGSAAGGSPGSAEWAAVLLGAASRCWQDSGAQGMATHRDDVAAVIERTVAALGRDAFEDAHRRGATLTAPEAVLAARSGAVPSV